MKSLKEEEFLHVFLRAPHFHMSFRFLIYTCKEYEGDNIFYHHLPFSSDCETILRLRFLSSTSSCHYFLLLYAQHHYA